MPPDRLPAWRLALRRWQQTAFDSWNAERPADSLIVATPGAGKTRFATRLAHALLADGAIARVLVVVPREHLKAQVARAMAGTGIHLDHALRNDVGALAPDVHGAAMTYQQVATAPRVFRGLARVPTLVILDEIHHAGDQATWGAAMREAFGGARHRVCLSGTPFRSDGMPIPFVRYHAGVCVADVAYDYANALADGVCRALVFPLHGGEAEWVSRDGEAMRASFETGLARRHQSERLRTALTQPAWLGDVLAAAHVRLLEIRAGGHPDAGGLVAAMNQDHARFVARLLEERTRVKPEIVLSDVDGASKTIAGFSRGRAPWIVAVHMISEGVDIPRLRVGVFASNVVSELYFRQFCGRFVRTIGGGIEEREAVVYVPDDPRIRVLASRITEDVRRAVKLREETDEVAASLAAATRDPRVPEEGRFASIAASATEGKVLDFGPLFNPVAYDATPDAPPQAEPDRRDGGRTAVAEATPPGASDGAGAALTVTEKREALRRELHVLVARASTQFGVDHRKVHATLNQRFGGPIATAPMTALEARKRLVGLWLARRSYDGLT